MIEIGVCDSEILAAQNLKEIIEKLAAKNKKDVHVTVYSSGAELIVQNSPADIIFLDIDLPKMDGIEVGRQIREKNKKSRVIIAACGTERFKEAFQIQAYRFITKPFVETEVEETLLAVIEEHSGERKLEVYAQRQKYMIEEKQIVYVKAEYGCVKIYGKKRNFRKEIGLRKLEQKLDFRMFARIHRACLVNLLYVSSYQGGQVKVGEEFFTVSRRERKEFERKYIEFDLKYRNNIIGEQQ